MKDGTRANRRFVDVVVVVAVEEFGCLLVDEEKMFSSSVEPRSNDFAFLLLLFFDANDCCEEEEVVGAILQRIASPPTRSLQMFSKDSAPRALRGFPDADFRSFDAFDVAGVLSAGE